MVDLSLLQSVSYIAGALGVCVAAIYYVMNLRISQRNQELMLKSQETSVKTQELALKSQQQAAETRQAQLFMQVFERYNKEFWKNWVVVMNKEYESYDEWRSGRSDPDIASERLAIGTYFIGVGILIKRGLLAPEQIVDLLGGPVIMWWQSQGKYIKEFRIRANYPTYAEYAEYLYDEMIKLRPVGYSPSYMG